MHEQKKKMVKEKASTRQLMGIKNISSHALVTGHGELVFFMIKPTNISVLSESSGCKNICLDECFKRHR